MHAGPGSLTATGNRQRPVTTCFKGETLAATIAAIDSDRRAILPRTDYRIVGTHAPEFPGHRRHGINVPLPPKGTVRYQYWLVRRNQAGNAVAGTGIKIQHLPLERRYNGRQSIQGDGHLRISVGTENVVGMVVSEVRNNELLANEFPRYWKVGGINLTTQAKGTSAGDHCSRRQIRPRRNAAGLITIQGKRGTPSPDLVAIRQAHDIQ